MARTFRKSRLQCNQVITYFDVDYVSPWIEWLAIMRGGRFWFDYNLVFRFDVGGFTFEVDEFDASRIAL